MRTHLRRLKYKVKSAISLRVLRLDKLRERFTCPVCDYSGVFLNFTPETGTRPHAQCPQCEGLERHRLQWLTMKELQKEIDFKKLRVLHMAPEKCIRERLQPLCATYLTADLDGKGVDRHEDLTKLSFANSSFDLVYCSHVLEHIRDDIAAIKEIRRVLSPGGIAVLPVPVFSDVTVEYPEPNWHEHGHVRAPGPEYSERYKKYFGTVRVFTSDDFDRRYQLYLYEDRTNWTNPTFPHRRPTPGTKHLDYVPICRADSQHKAA
jgi:SAM-dependent methyltransferase